jgi:AraC family transcriptional regulator
MSPRIENLDEKKLVGKRIEMSLINNRTIELWKSFMSVRKNISNPLTDDLISMQIYPATHFSDFKATNLFEKWATIEVADLDNVPAGMEKFILSGGLYAVFNYKGPSNDPAIFQYIFSSWLSSSDFVLDDRPHFEVLGRNYRNNDPSSEEEIWVPIRRK